MRTVIWIGWALASPAWADEALVDDGADTSDGDLVADSGATSAAVVPDAQLHASAVPPATTSTPPGQPPLCPSRSPRCLAFATTSASAEPPWDGLWLRRDVSGPTGTWRKKGKR